MKSNIPLFHEEWTVSSVASVSALAADTSAGLVADAHEGGVVQIRDATTGILKHAYGGHTATVFALAFSPDTSRSRLASASSDGTVQVWDAHSGEQILSYRGHSDGSEVYAVVWSPDGALLASGGSDRSVQIWDAGTGKMLASYEHSDWVWDVAWSSDGTRIVSASNEVLLHWWHEERLFGREQLLLTMHGIVNALAFRPRSSTILAVAGSMQLVEVWEIGRSGSQMIFSLPKPLETVHAIYQLSWAPDAAISERLLVREGVPGDGTLRLWKAAFTQRGSTLVLDHVAGIAAACWLDKHAVVVGTVEGDVLVRRLRTS